MCQVTLGEGLDREERLVGRLGRHGLLPLLLHLGEGIDTRASPLPYKRLGTTRCVRVTQT